jgi:excisionase family DNA binding protein
MTNPAQPTGPRALGDAAMPTAKLLLTMEEAAEQLGIGRTLMYSLIRTDQISSVQIGRLRRIRPADLEDYAARLSGTTPDAA